VIFIAFPLQQRLYERVSMLRFTYHQQRLYERLSMLRSTYHQQRLYERVSMLRFTCIGLSCRNVWRQRTLFLCH